MRRPPAADDARRELERAAHSGEADLSHGASRLLHPCFEAETVALLGEPARAGQLLDSLRPHSHLAVVGGHDGVTWYGSVSHYLGLLAATIGRTDDAVAHFRDAIAMHERAGAHPWLARSAYECARVLLARGGAEARAAALSLSNQALEIAERIGMTGLVEQARAVKLRAEGPEEANAAAPGGPPEQISSDEANAVASIFRREGEYWTIAYEGRVFRLKNSKGLGYLAELLRNPGRELHVAALVGGGRSRPSASGADPAEAGVRSSPLGDAGAILDARAKAEYGRRLEDLRETLAEAERFGDRERAAGVRAEIDFLSHELASALGLGGRDRRAASAVERARLSVTLAIKAALKRIAAQDPSLGQHLQTALRTGKYCSYTPDARVPISWTF